MKKDKYLNLQKHVDMQKNYSYFVDIFKLSKKDRKNLLKKWSANIGVGINNKVVDLIFKSFVDISKKFNQNPKSFHENYVDDNILQFGFHYNDIYLNKDILLDNLRVDLFIVKNKFKKVPFEGLVPARFSKDGTIGVALIFTFGDLKNEFKEELYFKKIIAHELGHLADVYYENVNDDSIETYDPREFYNMQIDDMRKKEKDIFDMEYYNSLTESIAFTSEVINALSTNIKLDENFIKIPIQSGEINSKNYETFIIKELDWKLILSSILGNETYSKMSKSVKQYIVNRSINFMIEKVKQLLDRS